MNNWIEQYSAALDARDAREQMHKPYIDAYTKLADRTAAAAAAAAAQVPSSSTPALPDRTATPPKSQPRSSTKGPLPDAQAATDLVATLRTDLANTQRARASLQLQVSELTASLHQLQTTHKESRTHMNIFMKQKAESERKLRDREEEIRGKAKLVEQAQDEMVSLQLQLFKAEEKRDELKEENKDLVERWMRRVGEEVDRVNRDTGWE